MLRLLQKFAPVLRFIFTFLGTYVLLTFIYNFYLKSADSAQYHPDFITHQVALQSGTLVEGLGYDAEVVSGLPEFSMHLMVNTKFVARIIEGCNAMSIIILFLSFMLAFFGKPKPTLLYIFAGIVLIYVTNIARIALIAIGIYEYPQHAHFLHTIAFPLVIYGAVFLLWVLWIRIFAKQVSG